MITLLVIVLALMLDARFGEPRQFHPLVGFGQLVRLVEHKLYGDSVIRGGVSVVLLIIPLTLLMLQLTLLPGGIVLEVMVLYLAIGGRSLNEHAKAVSAALKNNDLSLARLRVGMIVSRDTTSLTQAGISKATIESVLENGNDAVFGAIFWFIVAGAPGALAYRLVNTLDAMWGYRNDRYSHFGWAAARLDDLLNLVPARLTALGYGLAGQLRPALGSWRSQAGQWKSPNAGPVMAAGAGSLGILLGGSASYDGVSEARPSLGQGRKPEAKDIDAALRLIRRSLQVWLLALFIGVCFVESINVL